ncbi:chromatin-associated protein [Rhizophagus irregularis DAOM 181602=DAOM 197198]|nr:chromatin-associated protein [Rhizophagus irregularis DAOM 181602=DAOM 197198]
MNIQSFPQVRDFLKKCNLLEYYDRFISEGFDQLQSLLDVTEADLIAMDVKRGHRRRLQREIATIKGIPSNIPLYFQHGEEISDGQIHSSNNSIHQPPLNNVQPKILYVNGPSSINDSTMGSSQPRNRSTRDDDQPDPPDPPDNGSTKRS